MYNISRPVLIGTTTIEKSELLAALLSEYQVPYRLLNAQPENVEKEADIVAQAGSKKAVTIATNMAGRGTDIALGGNPVFLTKNTIANYFNQPNSDTVDSNVKELVLKQEESIKRGLEENYSLLLQQPIY